ncbi:MAG: hypothetical protein JNL70_16290 [Saprospiraceae bacterium]|nr:hypothetical protein [Saprospiraceae bacterium]
MSTQSRYKSQIQKAEDLPNVLQTQTDWNSIKDCERSVFRSLDITLVAERKVTLLDAMDSEVKTIIADALEKGILVRREDGKISLI